MKTISESFNITLFQITFRKLLKKLKFMNVDAAKLKEEDEVCRITQQENKIKYKSVLEWVVARDKRMI